MNLKIIIPLIILFVVLLGTAVYFGFFQKGGLSTEEVKPEVTMLKSPLGEFNPKNPQMTMPLESVPIGTIKLQISRDGGFQPKEFSVKAGEVVSLVLTSLDGTHTFYFDDKNLEKVKVAAGNDETRGISFVAPQQKGEYKFYCDIPGHRQNGEEGIMIVK